MFDMVGKKVKTVINQTLESGMHHARWDGTDESGSKVPSGVYIYRFIGGSQLIKTGKIVVN